MTNHTLPSLLFLSTLTATATGQMTWQLQTETLPFAAIATESAFDELRGVGVVFGGKSSGTNYVGLSDTWLWNGQWQQATPAHTPPARLGHSMAFDRARGVVVIAMGAPSRNGALLADTWTWNGTDWTQANATAYPSLRANASMAYDEASATCVLYGGTANGGIGLNDTWQWDGSNWTQRNPLHAPPTYAALSQLAYDSARQRMVLVGGDGNFTGGGAPAEHWEWVGGDWVQMPATTMLAKAGHTMFYDRARARVVVHGGYFYFGGLNDTWEFDGTNWIQITMPSPPPSLQFGSYALTGFYDTWRGQGLMVGTGQPHPTWIYSNPSPASVVAYAPGCQGPAGVPAITVVRRPILGDTYEIAVSNLLPQALTFMMTGWSMANINIGSLDPRGAGCFLRTSPDYQTPMIGTNVYTLGVPNDPVFLGVALHNQAVQFELAGPAPDLVSISVSNAVRMVMGNP